MEKYEFIHVSIHKKSKEYTLWEVSDGVNSRHVSVNVGKNDMVNARTMVMNQLGEEGWHLGVSHFYNEFMMQRKK